MNNEVLLGHIRDYLAQEGLPASYEVTAQRWFLPLLEEVIAARALKGGPLVLGISGCQGSGKSTLAGLLVRLLQAWDLRSVALSIDDFYLGHQARQTLAQEVHPLLATRGVPGTHEVPLALATLSALTMAGTVAVPRFDKAVDDRVEEQHWPVFAAPVDVIVLEGWCLGVEPEDEEALQQPVNALEAEEDPRGEWRRYVNTALAGDYQQWFEQLDILVMLKAPAFEKVYQWRQNQEDRLAEKLVNADAAVRQRLMSPAQVARFIQHYERLTRHALATLPAKAQVVFTLDDAQDIAGRL